MQVAKSLAVWQMVTLGQPVDSIVQVWYSATWDLPTLGCFRAAVAEVLRAASDLTPETEAYLRHWAAEETQPIPLQRARDQWLAQHQQQGQHCLLAALKRKQDRVDFGLYSVTGDFAVGAGGDTVASLAMWSVPPGSPQVLPHEHVLTALPKDPLAAFYPTLLTQPGAALKQFLSHAAPMRLMDAAVSVARAGVRRLGALARHDLVRVRLVHARLSATDSPGLVQEIAQSHPWSVTWSNVPDPREFHSLARALSPAGDCVHVAYSMNWSADVFGACVLDYACDPRGVRAIFKRAFDAHRALHLASPFRDVFFALPFWADVNLTDRFLAMAVYQSWLSEWMFKPEYTGGIVNVEPRATQPTPFYPPADPSTVLSLTWTYDPDIRFTPSVERMYA